QASFAIDRLVPTQSRPLLNRVLIAASARNYCVWLRASLDAKEQSAVRYAPGGEAMAQIEAVPLDVALSSRAQKQKSARTLRTEALERDAEEVMIAIKAQGAAQIDFSQESENPERYLSGLRSALSRK